MARAQVMIHFADAQLLAFSIENAIVDVRLDWSLNAGTLFANVTTQNPPNEWANLPEQNRIRQIDSQWFVSLNVGSHLVPSCCQILLYSAGTIRTRSSHEQQVRDGFVSAVFGNKWHWLACPQVLAQVARAVMWGCNHRLNLKALQGCGTLYLFRFPFSPTSNR